MTQEMDLRDEELRIVRYDMSVRKNVAAVGDHATSEINRGSPYDQDADRTPDSVDGSCPTTEILTTEEKAWQN